MYVRTVLEYVLYVERGVERYHGNNLYVHQFFVVARPMLALVGTARGDRFGGATNQSVGVACVCVHTTLVLEYCFLWKL